MIWWKKKNLIKELKELLNKYLRGRGYARDVPNLIGW